MAPTSSASETDLRSLIALADTSLHQMNSYSDLLVQTRNRSTNSRTTSSVQDPPNPLHVLKDASLLLKAHVTKLNLLLINKPYTPTAISKVIRDITSTCLPAMMSAVELAQPQIWGRILANEICNLIGYITSTMAGCMQDVRALTEAELQGGKKEVGVKFASGKDALAVTGILWEACDRVIALEDLDLPGVALRKAKEYQDMLKDAIGELKEWRENGVQDDEDEDEDEEGDDLDDEDLFGVQRLPKDRPDLVLAVDDTIGKLKKVDLLFTALLKRRVKAFTKENARMRENALAMDALIDQLYTIQGCADDLAATFYGLEEDEIPVQRKLLLDETKSVIKLVKLSWNGTEDEFTTWSNKWLEVIE